MNECVCFDCPACASGYGDRIANACAEIDAAVRRGELASGAANDIRNALRLDKPNPEPAE